MPKKNSFTFFISIVILMNRLKYTNMYILNMSAVFFMKVKDRNTDVRYEHILYTLLCNNVLLLCKLNMKKKILRNIFS